MMRRMLVAGLFLVTALAGCSSEEAEGNRIEFETTLGTFTVETWPGKTPVTAENFVRYVEDGFYDGLTFHRIAPGFVVQGGGYLPDHKTLRETRAPIVNEASAEVPNKKWTLSMARTSDPDSATSQFFINLADNKNLDKTATSAGYAVFGEVVAGFYVIEAMTQVEPGESFGAGGFFPKEPIVILSATIVSGPNPTPLPPPTPTDVSSGLITPGAFHVTAAEDAVLAWARNDGETGADLDWEVHAAGGGPVPEGLTFTFEDAPATIGGAGTATEAVHTLLHVTATIEGSFDLELHSGQDVSPFTLTAAFDEARVSQVGDAVTVQYSGTCVDGGKKFDSDEFSLTLGGGRAIVGFDLGLVGMALGEPATLVIPAAMAYGHTGGPCGGLDPADLAFDVEILSFD